MCNATSIEFEELFGRRVLGDFSGGRISSDGGVLLLRELDRKLGLSTRLADCFKDHRNPKLIEHDVTELLRQRLFALICGYEDLNDHDTLSVDPLLATAVGKADPSGHSRRDPRDRDQPLASASTLGRLERTPTDATKESRYEKIVCDPIAFESVVQDAALDSYAHEPGVIVIDLDPSDIELHGNQSGRFFHGYYGHYCYLPLYAYIGEYPVATILRRSNIDAPVGAEEVLSRLVERIRSRWPGVQLIVRGDSGFCRDSLMTWCESQNVDFIFGLAKNPRLTAAIAQQLQRARRRHLVTAQPARFFRDFSYRTRSSWSRARRVVGKAEHLVKGANPRFVVTSLRATQYEKRYLYEELYCARGEMENRIKEHQLDLFGDRASSTRFRANSIRGLFSMAAQLMIVELRAHLHGTELQRAQAATIREKLIKVGTLVTLSVRRVYFRFSSAFPRAELFRQLIQRLRAPPPALPA